MSLTKIVSPYFARRRKALLRQQSEAIGTQREVLRSLVERASDTVFGRNHAFTSVASYEDFCRMVPLNDYDSLKDDIDRMRHGEPDILWRGTIKWYAKSSGTTNDRSKFIPVSPEGLQRMHYMGGRDAVALYLGNYPDSRIFDGKALILGGSHQPNFNLPQSLVGDLSAILIENINPIVNLCRVPKKKTALLSDFKLKRDRIAEETMCKDVTNISGVPSWMMSVLVRVLELSGKDNIAEVWPNLEVFFHGGIAFGPYRSQYEQIIPKEKMRYMETYNASEGFFGLQSDPADPAMMLMTDYDVFYEFLPMDEFGQENPHIVPLEGVETGRNYAMIITTSCGLWRYIIGDTVRFTSRRPYKFVITGRTKCFINAFGEEVIQDNADQALAHACKITGAEVREYTAAPVFMDSEARCRHQWLVEFATRPDDLSRFAEALDKKLQEINSDYEAKRAGSITLQPLEVIEADSGLFERWLASKGKLGGQHKVPRLANSRAIIDECLALNSKRN